MRRQASLALTIVLAIARLDQVSKAWAWRHLLDVHVNSGGDIMLGGSGLGSWFRDPISGAVFDAADTVVLGMAAVLLLRRHRRPYVLVSGSVLLAGWSSNLLDRLGTHYVTAPGSVRGVVDFIPWGGRYWNVADIAIVLGSVGFVVSLAVAGASSAVRPRKVKRTQPHRPFARAHARLAAAGGVVTACVLAVIGAIAYAGVSGPVSALAAPGH
jgi:lipoprotein signal peptidase